MLNLNTKLSWQGAAAGRLCSDADGHPAACEIWGWDVSFLAPLTSCHGGLFPFQVSRPNVDPLRSLVSFQGSLILPARWSKVTWPQDTRDGVQDASCMCWWPSQVHISKGVGRDNILQRWCPNWTPPVQEDVCERLQEPAPLCQNPHWLSTP